MMTALPSAIRPSIWRLDSKATGRAALLMVDICEV